MPSNVVPDMRPVPFAALLLVTLLSACGSQPGISVSISKQTIPMVLSSSSRITGWWSGEHGDAFVREIPLSIVHTSTPITLQFESGQGASLISGWIYDKDAPAPSGDPIEKFTLQGRAGAYEPRTIMAGRTYEILVNVQWSGLLVHGEEAHVFRLKIEAP